MKLHRLIPKPIRSAILAAVRMPGYLAGYRMMDTRRLYAYPEIRHLRRFFAAFDVDCVFDVGANRGQYGTMLRREVGYRGRIISFEPDPATARLLRETARGDSGWEVREVALADREGVQHFHIMRDSQFNSLSSPRLDETTVCADGNRVEETVEVPTEPLSVAFCKAEQSGSCRRPFLKMDTQGFDMPIVMASEHTLQRFVGVQTEVAAKKLYVTSASFVDVLAWYESHGFDLSAIVLNNEGHFPVLVESDCIFVRRDLVPRASPGRV